MWDKTVRCRARGSESRVEGKGNMCHFCFSTSRLCGFVCCSWLLLLLLLLFCVVAEKHKEHITALVTLNNIRIRTKEKTQAPLKLWIQQVRRKHPRNEIPWEHRRRRCHPAPLNATVAAVQPQPQRQCRVPQETIVATHALVVTFVLKTCRILW